MQYSNEELELIYNLCITQSETLSNACKVIADSKVLEQMDKSKETLSQLAIKTSQMLSE